MKKDNFKLTGSALNKAHVWLIKAKQALTKEDPITQREAAELLQLAAIAETALSELKSLSAEFDEIVERAKVCRASIAEYLGKLGLKLQINQNTK